MKHWQTLRKYAIPQMIGLIFNSIYFIIDGMFIGKLLGTTSLAAAGIAIPVIEVMIALSMIISVGASVMISFDLGHGDDESAKRRFNKANTLTLIVSLSIMVVGNILVVPFAKALGATPELMPETIIYLRTFLTASPFLVFSFTLSTFARNDNAPKLAMWALIIGSVSNIVLDWVFMVPMQMGMMGAALATALGPVFSVLILLPHFVGRKGKLSFEWVMISPKDIKEIVTKGISAFITNFSIGLVTLIYNRTIVSLGYGTQALSSHVLIGYVSLIALTAFLGSSQGIQPVLSQYLGKNDRENIRSLSREIIIFNFLLAMIFTVSIMTGGSIIFRHFTHDELLIAKTLSISRIYFTNLVFAAGNIVIATCLQALNKQKKSTFLSLLRTTIPLLFFIKVLPMVFGETGLWFAMTATEIVTFILSMVFLVRVLRQISPEAREM